jgi:hypothetical protein
MYTLNESTAELMVLNVCPRAHGAELQHGDRLGCLAGTREYVLSEIERWIEDSSPVFWLNGLAGTGKSTIAQTAAERLFADNRLGASFFCSRGVEDRINLRLIFPTLAFQLAHKYPDFRASLIPILQSNPDIVHESLQDQMQMLLVEPLQSVDISTVILIDALDECRDEEPESAMLLVLGQSVSKVPRVKFFITSRPEKRVKSGFRGPLLEGSTDIFVLHGVEPRIVDNDIRRFFTHQLSQLTPRYHQGESWPTEEQLDSLCRRAAGLFVYAVAAVGFLQHKYRPPSDLLNVIMESPESTAHEGRAGLMEYANLDSLYISILRDGCCRNNVVGDAMVRSVLSALILVANPISPSAIAVLMGRECDEVLSTLQSIRSLLVQHDDVNEPIRLLHKSFADFVTDPTRCTDTRFYILPFYHTALVLSCLKLMNKSLKRNVCSIPDYALNAEVADLQEKIEENGVRGALEHACRSWDKNLIITEYRTFDVFSALREFLEGRFLFWLETLSVLGAVGDAARALVMITKWLNEVCSEWLG